MEDRSDFTTTLRAFMERARRSNSDLALLTGISINTIEKWTSGVVRRPRFVADVLKLARALALDAAETSALLIAAGHPSLPTLHAQAQQTGDTALRPLLEAWPVASAPAPASAAALPDPPPPQSPRHQLHAPVADFVGRAREIDQLVTALRRALAEQRGAIISGVQGMGGIGKTELAYIIAHQLRDAFPDAQIVLNLRGSSATPLTPEQTLHAVIHTLTPDARLPADLPALEQHYRTLLHNSRMLILADDARDAAQARALTPPVGCALLITSRQRFTLPGMATVDLEQLTRAEAVRLVRRICERLSVEEAEALAEGCGELPLALRVSSSLLKTDPALSVRVYLDRLMDERQRLSQLRDPEDRQLDVEASLSLSYAQLDAAVQQVFRQLGVLAADFATELAQAVVEARKGVDVEAVLHVLLRRNLVIYDSERSRWRLHDLLRDLARRYLETAGESDVAWWRYARAAVQIAEETQEQYDAGGEGVLAALARFDLERAHIDAAWAWAALHAGTPEGDRLLLDNAAATRYIGSLRYDLQHVYIPQWEGTLVAARRLGDRHAEGLALNMLGAAFDMVQCAILYYEQALTIAREIDDRRLESRFLNNLGGAYTELGEARRAIPYLEQALTIARTIGDWRAEGAALGNLGGAYIQLGEARRAIPHLEQVLTIAIGHRRTEGWILTELGDAYIQLGEARRAISAYEQALTIAREIGNRYGEGWALTCLAYAQARQGDLARATTSFGQAIALLGAMGDRYGEAECNWLFGLALAQWGERERALPLLRAAVAYEQEIGHAKAAEHAALLIRLEAGEDLPAELLHPAGQHAVGADADALPDAALL